MTSRCPCCGTPPGAGSPAPARSHASSTDRSATDDGWHCPACGHRWRDDRLPPGHYQDSRGRNDGANGAARKHAERLAGIAPLLRNGLRILEIGCADGTFGAQVKAAANVDYWGVELSQDAARAELRLDRVVRGTAAEVPPPAFDLLLAFHVLEHLADPGAELAVWRRLLTACGTLLVEVPHRAGHPLLDTDRHPEHLHQFTPASLAALFERSDFSLQTLSIGHFESALYRDSLRVTAAPARTAEARREALHACFVRLLPNPFVVWGIGGDFRNYVLPLLPRLDVAALCDSDTARHGETVGGHTVTAYDAARLAGLPVLIASSRHAASIRDALIAQGIPATAIVDLEQIYGDS